MTEIPFRILNVDDNEAGRYAVTRILQRAGYEVAEASTGAEALEKAQSLPDLVLLDIKLPDVSGLEVCRLLKSSPRTAGVMVLHVSANFVDAEHRVEALEGGADGYLVYPLQPSELLANVRSLLRLKRAEAEAREAVQDWRATFDAINDGVCLMDKGGRVLRCNRTMCELLEKQPDEVVGQVYAELLRLRFISENVPDFADLLREPGREAADLRVGDRWFRLTRDPVVDSEGAPRGAVCIVSDITDRKRLNAELRRQADELIRANTAKDEFLAMLGHELRNPLSPILTALELMRVNSPEDAPLQRSREVIERQTRHMARLVDDLLDVSRITRGKIELRRETVNLASIVCHAVQTTQPLIMDRQHRLEVRLPAEPLHVDADPLRLEQILANLLNNAAKYTDSGGEIHVWVESGGRQAEIHVADTGRGIPLVMLPHIFDLFTQVSPTIDRTQGGLGLGLTLVRRLVEMHGGTVEARSPGFGQGSEFIIRLPISGRGSQVPGPKSSDAAPAAPVPGPGTSELGPKTLDLGRKVLVVEDNLDARETLEALLDLWGHSVRSAANGHEAVAVVGEWKPDVALIDIGLPGMDGYQVAAAIRAHAVGTEVRLVALTGYGQPEDRERALDAGFNAHAVKPVDPDLLQRLIA